jgi:hypothetical protein
MLAHQDPKKLVAELTARHVHDLDGRESTLLFYLLLGYEVKQMAILLDRAEPTVYRWLGALEQRVLEFTDLPICLDILHAWATLQYHCCPRATREMIERYGSA